MEILILLTLLQIKHCWADFVLQTYQQTVKKGVWLDPVGISHSIEHAYSSLVVLFIFSLFWPLNMAVVVSIVIFEAVVHYLIDYTKVRYGSKDSTKPIFWHQFGADQLLHQLTYTLMVFILLYEKIVL
jgi:fumarate reductase subunit D